MRVGVCSSPMKDVVREWLPCVTLGAFYFQFLLLSAVFVLRRAPQSSLHSVICSAAIKAGVATGTLGMLAAAGAAAALSLRFLPTISSTASKPGGARARLALCASIGGATRAFHLLVSSVATLLSVTALLAPWLIDVVGPPVNVRVLYFLEHVVCSGPGCGGPFMSSSGVTSIVDLESACSGNAACTASYTHFHVAAVFATGGAHSASPHSSCVPASGSFARGAPIRRRVQAASGIDDGPASFHKACHRSCCAAQCGRYTHGRGVGRMGDRRPFGGL